MNRFALAALASSLIGSGVAAASPAPGQKPAQQPVCDARALGATGDGTTNDTAAIQKAVDTCSSQGGGTVRLLPGRYVIAPIILKSNITLDLQTGATLLGTTDHTLYPRFEMMRVTTLQPLLTVRNAENVTLSGGGIIDGQGQLWWDIAHSVKDAGILGNDHPRPMGLVLDHSRHLRIENITMQNAAFWQIVPYYSDDITISHVRILAPQHSPNTDAIDPFSSSNIHIDHIYADVGDDNIAIKSGKIDSPGPDDPSKNIWISDCEFLHGHGLSIGSELSGGAQNIHAERIHFKGTDQGIRVKSNRDRGHDVSNLSFKDITMEDVKTAILISEYYPKVLPEGDVAAAPEGRLTPHFHDISIENVRATGSSAAGVIVGLPESPILGLSLRNVHLEARTGLVVAYATVSMDNVSVKAETGESIKMSRDAKVTFAKK